MVRWQLEEAGVSGGREGDDNKLRTQRDSSSAGRPHKWQRTAQPSTAMCCVTQAGLERGPTCNTLVKLVEPLSEQTAATQTARTREQVRACSLQRQMRWGQGTPVLVLPALPAHCLTCTSIPDRHVPWPWPLERTGRAPANDRFPLW